MRKYRLGFTLIEMMIAMTVAAVVVAGVYFMSVSSARTMQRENAKIALNEDLRSAAQLLRRDLDRAGYRTTQDSRFDSRIPARFKPTNRLFALKIRRRLPSGNIPEHSVVEIFADISDTERFHISNAAGNTLYLSRETGMTLAPKFTFDGSAIIPREAPVSFDVLVASLFKRGGIAVINGAATGKIAFSEILDVGNGRLVLASMPNDEQEGFAPHLIGSMTVNPAVGIRYKLMPRQNRAGDHAALTSPSLYRCEFNPMSVGREVEDCMLLAENVLSFFAAKVQLKDNQDILTNAVWQNTLYESAIQPGNPLVGVLFRIAVHAATPVQGVNIPDSWLYGIFKFAPIAKVNGKFYEVRTVEELVSIKSTQY